MINNRKSSMNFTYDLAQYAKQELIDAGITVPDEWDDYSVCLNYYEISQRWFNSSIPYKVLYSEELLRKIPSLSTEEQKAVKEIEDCLLNCKPITSYMSKLIKKTDMKNSDFLLKNWGIYHVHLEKLSLPKLGFTKPNLLFFQPKGNVVHFIDVKPHPKGATWFDRGLLEIIYANWPWLLLFFYGAKPLEIIPDDKIHQFTKNAVTILDFHGGALMPSNLGVASSGNSALAVRETDRIFNNLRLHEQNLTENEVEIKKLLYKSTGLKIEEKLEYELIIEDDYFVAYEKHTNAKIRLFQNR